MEDVKIYNLYVINQIKFLFDKIFQIILIIWVNAKQVLFAQFLIIIKVWDFQVQKNQNKDAKNAINQDTLSISLLMIMEFANPLIIFVPLIKPS